MLRRFAGWLIRALAVAVELFEFELLQARQRRYELEHPTLTAEPIPPGEQLEFAKRFCDDIKLRRALYDACHKFSPKAPTPEA